MFTAFSVIRSCLLSQYIFNENNAINFLSQAIAENMTQKLFLAFWVTRYSLKKKNDKENRCNASLKMSWISIKNINCSL